MKRLALASAALALAVLFSAPSFAADAASGPVTCSDGTTSPHAGRGACSKHGGIKKDDASAATAAAPAAPAKAAKSADAASGPVTCTDGTTSKKAGRGACSKHGGVKKDDAAAPAAAAKPAAAAPAAAAAKPAAAAAAAPAAPAAPAAAPAKTASAAGSGGSVNADASGATAKCKDGSYSHSKTHSGTCSKHGGVAEWLDGSAKQ
jgi:hypothetical protein